MTNRRDSVDQFTHRSEGKDIVERGIEAKCVIDDARFVSLNSDHKYRKI